MKEGLELERAIHRIQQEYNRNDKRSDEVFRRLDRLADVLEQEEIDSLKDELSVLVHKNEGIKFAMETLGFKFDEVWNEEEDEFEYYSIEQN